jgi:Flp pilus assembly pilin Flp
MVDRFNSLVVGTVIRLTSVELRREEGQALTEYALVLALIVVGSIGIMTIIGTSVTSKFQAVCDAVVGTVTTTSCGRH